MNHSEVSPISNRHKCESTRGLNPEPSWKTCQREPALPGLETVSDYQSDALSPGPHGHIFSDPIALVMR